jgi:hypothetical protein
MRLQHAGIGWGNNELEKGEESEGVKRGGKDQEPTFEKVEK